MGFVSSYVESGTAHFYYFLLRAVLSLNCTVRGRDWTWMSRGGIGIGIVSRLGDYCFDVLMERYSPVA